MSTNVPAVAAGVDCRGQTLDGERVTLFVEEFPEDAASACDHDCTELRKPDPELSWQEGLL